VSDYVGNIMGEWDYAGKIMGDSDYVGIIMGGSEYVGNSMRELETGARAVFLQELPNAVLTPYYLLVTVIRFK